MRNSSWDDLVRLIDGKKLSYQPMGVNMFNFSFNHSMGEIRKLAGPEVVLV